MAKVTAPVPGATTLSVRGAFYVRTWRGKLIAQAWPRPRKKLRTLKQREREQDFADTIWSLRYTDAGLTVPALDAFENTKILWRDALTAQLYGTVFSIPLGDGRLLHPIRFVKLVRAALDQISKQSGDTLTHDATRWTTIPGAAANQRFTSTGPTSNPAWQTKTPTSIWDAGASTWDLAATSWD